MAYEDPQEAFYRKLLASLAGQKIKRAGLTKTGVGIFIETDTDQLVFYSRIGENVYPIDIKARKL